MPSAIPITLTLKSIVLIIKHHNNRKARRNYICRRAGVGDLRRCKFLPNDKNFPHLPFTAPQLRCYRFNHFIMTGICNYYRLPGLTFVLLHFTLLHFKCYPFLSKLKATPSTSKKIMTHFIAILT